MIIKCLIIVLKSAINITDTLEKDTTYLERYLQFWIILITNTNTDGAIKLYSQYKEEKCFPYMKLHQILRFSLNCLDKVEEETRGDFPN